MFSVQVDVEKGWKNPNHLDVPAKRQLNIYSEYQGMSQLKFYRIILQDTSVLISIA